MNCPRCQVPTHLETIKEPSYSIEVDKCPKCEGIWFDKSELDHLQNVVQPVLFEIRKINRSTDQLVGLHCQKCEDKPLLVKANHPRDRKVIIDYCDGCGGVWLDKGELGAIQKEGFFNSFMRLFG